jgi:zinc transporter
MERNLQLSPVFYEILQEGSRSTRVDFADGQLIGVLNDVLFDFSFDASHISTMVLSVGPRLLVTARSKSLRSIDRLRVAVKAGDHFSSSTSLLVHLLRDQSDVLVTILRTSIAQVDTIEDKLLAGSVESKRADLGQLRRVLVRLKRLLAPEPAALFRLLSRPPDWMREDDVLELRQSTEEFGVSLNDIDTLQERIKLLQEEISARIAEQNNRSLFVLSVFTVLALPVNMIAGLFGMNVGGIPFAENKAGFAIVVTVVLSITVAAGWWVFHKRIK